MSTPSRNPSTLPIKHVALLGSTGSIGTASLEVLECLLATDPQWRVTALSTHSRSDLLTRQAEAFRPRYAVVTGPEPEPALRARIKAAGAELLLGPKALEQVAADPDCGTVIGAIVGAAGLPGVLAAVTAGKRVALANKESLVVAGEVVMPLARRTGSVILPVDSEHSAIFQALAAGRRGDLKRALLTASGGPFRTATQAHIDNATVQQALNHPTWRMGGKITIDSATLFNKAFELIEAKFLFDLPESQIDIVVHPQSIIHSMVEFADGSTLAQLSPPDMKVPIQYALTHPARQGCPGPKMDWTRPHTLTFEPPDPHRFPALTIAREVARAGGTTGAVVNAANEVAVEAFLAGRVRFGAISRTVREVLDAHSPSRGDELGTLLEADAWARRQAADRLAG